MKKIFTTILLFITLFCAQAADGSLEALKAKATEETRVLVQKLGLNEIEYIKIKSFVYNKLVAIKEANEMYANEPEMRTKKLQAIEEEFNKNLVATLTPKQQQNYLALSNK
ncbi:MAG: hypothetical protein COW65_19465 [Cytophagales bacterium CG18_big_fil_WC_8_21_14_2_50_42_9]|nr:MAG: hypothetical protein COW65_19465 [Cytophagales bacterium CG18_big_fil_WC_8_21_14_2_50_42_9]